MSERWRDLLLRGLRGFESNGIQEFSHEKWKSRLFSDTMIIILGKCDQMLVLNVVESVLIIIRRLLVQIPCEQEDEIYYFMSFTQLSWAIKDLNYLFVWRPHIDVQNLDAH